MRPFQLFFSFFLFFSFAANAQHETAHHSTAPESEQGGYFRAAVLIGHTFIPAGTSSEHLAIPSWGLDLEYWVNRQWGVGLHNDIEIETFLVEHGNEMEIMEREYPVVVTLDALYKPWRELVLQVGPGWEFEKTEDYFLIRFGVEYEFELHNGWDISPSFFYDTRQHAYDTWSIALGVGKRF